MRIRTLPTILATLAGLALAAGSASAQLVTVGDGGPGPVKAPHLTAELVTLGGSPNPVIAPGGTLQAGLVLTMEDGWHVYWKNAGDSGEPPHVKWTLPEGFTDGPMQFDAPGRLPLGPLMDFGYVDTAAFPIALTAASTVKPGPVHLDAKVDWLVCREVCIPGKANLGLNLTVDPAAANAPAPPLVGALGTAISRLPPPLPANAKLTINGGAKEFVLTLTTGKRETNAEFYPFDEDKIANAARQIIEPLPDGVRLRVTRAEDLTKLPASLHGVLKLTDAIAYEVTAPVVPGEIAAAPASAVSTESHEPAAITTFSAIALALAGGVILNLMPCVFPVLFLKGLALVQSSSEDRKRLRAHGLVYTLGILCSFWAIVGVLLALRATGSQAGWGFQLQSPSFIAILASFIFFFGLSLAGMFDIGLSLTSAGGSLAQKQGYTGSFFTGVLATIVATPCTAPLMGAAIGFALAQPPVVTFAVFTALGLGLALPYLLLSIQPAWTRLLPKPGAWMETMKQLTSVPLFATAIWLAWVYGRLYTSTTDASAVGQGVDHLAKLLTCFLVLAIAGWVMHRYPARLKGTIIATMLAVAALAIPLYQPKETTLAWQPYTRQTLDAARAAGHPVFIDFTAAWCLSCQVNEKLVLKSPDVQKQFASGNFTLLRADWTQYDPAITQQLASIGRSGVPTYVIYPASTRANPDVLPELLTKPLVLEAITRDTQAK